jgi:VWFA-related protein
MRTAWMQIVAWAAAAALLATPVAMATQSPGYTLRIDSDLVLVHVTARDRRGNPVRDLARGEFLLLEDGRRQSINSVDYEVPRPAEALSAQNVPLLTSGTSPQSELTRGLRLVILFFDFTSLQPDQTSRAFRAANSYVKDISSLDRVAVVTLGEQLRVRQDFTSDRDLLQSTLANVRNMGIAGEDSSAEAQPYNLFSNDRRLRALQDIANVLQIVPQKKMLVFFAGQLAGGVQNDSQLARAVEAAARANLSVYAVDARGLVASPALGDASVASVAGRAVLSGRAVLADIGQRFESRELLRVLASATSGRSFFDNNDLREPFRCIAADTGEYYVLSYRSNNRARDGRFRHIVVRSTRRDVKFEHRAGYYTRREWTAVTKQQRAEQLEQEIVADLPSTDLPVYAWTAYLRVDREHYFVPLVVLVPGEELGSSASGNNSHLDLLARVRDERGRSIGEIRDAIVHDPNIRSKYLQYNSGVTLPPGTYRIRVVVRDNSNGKIGSFETPLVLPSTGAPFHVSPVLIGRRVPFRGGNTTPLVIGKEELLPNPAGIFFSGDDVSLRSEVYRTNSNAKGMVITIRLLSESTLTYDSGPLPVTFAADTGAVVIEAPIPNRELHSGTYICQLTVVDESLGMYSVTRLPLTILNATKESAHVRMH